MFKNKVYKDVLYLALPAVGEMVLYMMIWFFDTAMVGQYGGEIAVSSVGLSSEFLSTFTNVFIAVGICIGITSYVARKCGAKLYDEAEEYISTAILIGFLISAIISLLTYFFCGNLLTLAGADQAVKSNGIIFMKIASIAIFFNMLDSLINSVLRGTGNTVTPLIGSIIINIINIVLDYLLIFGKLGFPSLGIKGSALATVFAQLSGFIYLSLYIQSKGLIKFRFPKKFNIYHIKELLSLSVPASLQEGSFDISRLFCSFIVMHLGTVAFASNQIATTIESISFMPGWGFAVASTTLVGHKIGEGNRGAAKEYAYTCAAFGIMTMSLCSVLFLTLPSSLIKIFISPNSRDVISNGTKCLMVAAVEQPFMAASLIFGGSLKGLGDTKTPFLISVFTCWVIRLPLMYYFIYYLSLPVVYVWIITAIQWFLDGILAFLLFKTKFHES